MNCFDRGGRQSFVYGTDRFFSSWADRTGIYCPLPADAGQNCLYAGDRTLGMGRRQTVGKFHDFIWPTALCRDDFIGVYH